MIADLKPYPAMKDSDVEWLGDVPEHWEVLPPKRVLRSESSGGAIIKNTAATEARPGYVPAFSASGQDIWLPDASHFGDALVLSAVGARCGRTFRASGEWGVVANTHVLRPLKGQMQHFWWYVTNNQDWWDRAGAAQPFVRVSATLNRAWAVPPLPEQAAIVRYLDHVDRRVRRLTRAKRKLIALLTEQKQAIIHRAVTRGLDPDVPLKDSGVEWLGEVPEHWEVRQFRTLGSGFNNGTAVEQLASGESDYIVSRIETISNGVINYSKVGYLADDSTVQSYYLRENDFLISHINSYARVGNSARYNGERRLLHGMNLIRMTPLSCVSPVYAEYLMKSNIFIGSMQRACKPAINQVSVTTAAIKAIRLPLPPLPEQAAIVEYLGQAIADIDSTITRAEREIELLSEYRTRLIADVVTGKLDVREAAADLPEVDPLAEDDDADELDADLALDAAELDETPEEVEA